MTQSIPPLRRSKIGHLGRALAKPLVVLFVYCLFVLWFEANCLHKDLLLSTEIQAVVSLFLGSLMALRINTSYSHWWQARAMWGRLVNEERNLAAYTATLPNVPAPAKERVREILVTFPPTLMNHLRDAPGAIHHPAELSRRAFHEVAEWKRLGYIDGWEWTRLSSIVERFLQICGGCERIRNSLLMRSYHGVVLSVIVLYLAAAPFALKNDWWTTPLVMVGGALFLCLEKIASDIEEPFGTAPEDIPMENLCATIEKTVNQLLPPSASTPWESLSSDESGKGFGEMPKLV